MTNIILRAAQAGLLKIWYLRTLRNKSLCDLSSPEWLYLKNVAAKSVHKTIPTFPVKPLTMSHLYPQFYFLGFGHSLALAAFILELFSRSNMDRGMRGSLKKKAQKNAIPLLH